MNKSISIILVTICLDAMGIGLIMPILPELLKSISGAEVSSLHYGILLAIYALMQFIFAPILGILSDRFGRKPILVISLAGAAADYLLMASATTLLWLYIGRIVAGITGANMAVATAYITDITSPSERAKRFGLLGAVFGIGFIAGPVLGGALGEWYLHAPFLAAAIMNGINLIMTICFLKESKVSTKYSNTTQDQSLFLRFYNLINLPNMPVFFAIFLIITLVSQVPATIWVIHGQDRYGWNMLIAGISLAAYGVCHSISQAFAIDPLVKKLGEKKTLVIGLICDGIGLILLSVSAKGWMPFALLPLFALGGIAVPSLQSMMSRCISDERQGELQGFLSSLNSFGAIIGPILVTALYSMTQASTPGIIWAVAAILYLPIIPFLFYTGKH